jgi:hypothetical protein
LRRCPVERSKANHRIATRSAAAALLCAAVVDPAVPVAAPDQSLDVKIAEPQAIPASRDLGQAVSAMAAEKPAEK